MKFDPHTEQQILASLVEAGKKILEVYALPEVQQQVKTKKDKSPVTLADELSHEYLLDQLARITPDIPIISEEADLVDYEERKNYDYFWLLDPLDGTHQFMKRNDQFCVSLGLIEGDHPIWGGIYAPVFEDMYYGGSMHQAAYKTDASLSEKTALEASAFNGKMLMSIRSNNRPHKSELKILNGLPIKKQINMGSAIKFGMIAAGEANVYYRHGKSMEWDTAAGQAIVEACGGQVWDAKDKSPIRYNKPELENTHFYCFSKGFEDHLP
ncbi:MAG: 3'(2'),5'-bisphosphate nucleotidase CysQ [Cyclobacteriaceae bacterium]|nr:3'(2'),5'-bisphosphate nucleotidase CysQ [Cyclobacteriaceae bacterium]MCH8515422.1 3'(2'),5'-bisphosphate nucleotidase CysQ [Cyclobacteriaceae bacterium]